MTKLVMPLKKSQGHAHPTTLHNWDLKALPELRLTLLNWYEANERPMPWRAPCGSEIKHHDAQRAYQVWVSEVMLQQTQVGTVIPFYQKWMDQWPTLKQLAEAPMEDVLKTWSGLGYYSRAQRLVEGAQFVMEKFDGKLPESVKELLQVPGIGPYTAGTIIFFNLSGAVASIAYHLPEALVDGNVVRVISRLRALGMNPKSNEAIALHWCVIELRLIQKATSARITRSRSTRSF